MNSLARTVAAVERSVQATARTAFSSDAWGRPPFLSGGIATADGVQPVEVLCRKLQGECTEVAAELRKRARTDHRNRAMGPGPGNGHLVGAGAELVRYRELGVENQRALSRVLRLEDPAAKTFCAPLLALPILAGEHAAAERRPGDDTEPERLGGREEVGLGLAMN
jgi:hypothetical protein